MELFVKGRKVSLFGDEVIELTKNWNDQQIISGYGSWSKSFSLPIDANNASIFGNYNIIGINSFNPNEFLDASIIVNEYEIIGNIQVLSFSTKQGQPFQYNVIFYGEEKNLIKLLNNSAYPKLNNMMLDNISFTFQYIPVIASWVVADSLHFVPLMANKRALCYRDRKQEGNINSTGNYTTGVTMRDLNVAYNFKQLLEKLFSNHNITFNYSTNVANFLKELYVMLNTKVEYGGRLTYVNTETTDNVVDGWSILELYPVNVTDVTSAALPGTVDVTSWDSILDYTLSNNYYEALNTVKYNFSINFSAPQQELEFPISSASLLMYDYTTNAYLYGTTFQLGTDVSFSKTLTAGQKVFFQISYDYQVWIEEEYDPNTPQLTGYYTNINAQFKAGDVNAKIKITEASDADYNYVKSTINFPDMLTSDFFTNFCKSFNIFFIYDDVNKIVNLYFKYDLPAITYDLTKYLLLDKDYTFNNQVKYKTIDYMFAEGKDINNIAWKRSGPTGLQYGEYKKVEKYDVGNDKLEYKSMFTVFPRTELNKTNDNNDVLESTDITLHSELNESLAGINTDFLLMYRLPYISGLTFKYNIQTGLISGGTYVPGYSGFTEYNVSSDCGPDGPNGYSLDYTKLTGVVFDNTTVKYEVEMDFLLPTDLLYTIKVYDRILVHGVYYEISTIINNIKNGYTKIKLITNGN